MAVRPQTNSPLAGQARSIQHPRRGARPALSSAIRSEGAREEQGRGSPGGRGSPRVVAGIETQLLNPPLPLFGIASRDPRSVSARPSSFPQRRRPGPRGLWTMYTRSGVQGSRFGAPAASRPARDPAAWRGELGPPQGPRRGLEDAPESPSRESPEYAGRRL